MKKIIVFLSVFIVIFSAVYAQEPTAVIIESKTAKPGETVEIHISIENNTGLIAAKLELNYDTDRIKLMKAEDKGLLQGATFSQNVEKYPYIMLWNSASSKNFTDNGALVTLTFEVLETAASGEAFIDLAYEQENVYDVDLNDVSLQIKRGGIMVDNPENISQSTGSRGSMGKSNKVGASAKPVIDASKQIILTIGKKEAKVYGKTVENDVAPKIVNDRTVLPIRFVAEALGADVEWFEDEQRVKITKEQSVIDIFIGSDNALVNKQEKILDCQAFIENDRTFIPIRFVSESMGAKVDWHEQTQNIIISSLN